MSDQEIGALGEAYDQQIHACERYGDWKQIARHARAFRGCLARTGDPASETTIRLRAQTHLHSVTAYVALGNYPSAIRHAEQLVNLSRKYPASEFSRHSDYERLGSLQLSAGRTEDAARSYCQSVARVFPRVYVELLAITLTGLASIESRDGNAKVAEFLVELSGALRAERKYRTRSDQSMSVMDQDG